MSGTFGEMMAEAMACKTQEEADAFFLREVGEMQAANPSWSGEQCARTVRDNLGYMAGYYDKAASEHVAKFWKASHPVFGGPGYWDLLKSEDAFKKGQEHAREGGP